MAFYAYVIYSARFKCYYKGHCESLEKRLLWHNQGKTKSTKPFRPWRLIYYEEFESRQEAIRRETFFKSAAGRKYLEKKITMDNRGSPPD